MCVESSGREEAHCGLSRAGGPPAGWRALRAARSARAQGGAAPRCTALCYAVLRALRWAPLAHLPQDLSKGVDGPQQAVMRRRLAVALAGQVPAHAGFEVVGKLRAARSIEPRGHPPAHFLRAPLLGLPARLYALRAAARTALLTMPRQPPAREEPPSRPPCPANRATQCCLLTSRSGWSAGSHVRMPPGPPRPASAAASVPPHPSGRAGRDPPRRPQPPETCRTVGGRASLVGYRGGPRHEEV